MHKHEDRCTGNPLRECGLCNSKHNIHLFVMSFKSRFKLTERVLEPYREGKPYDASTHVVEWIGEPVTMQEIRNSVGDCPNCILAILRQTGFNRHYFEGFSFDYRKEFSDTMKEKNREQYEDQY